MVSSLSIATDVGEGYRRVRSAGLDIVRLLAAFLVLATHCSAIFLPELGLAPPVSVLLGSYFGVELFFVLSGFLIGRILFQIAESDPTLRGWLIFMTRRWIRTLPLYFLWMLVLVLVAPLPANFPKELFQHATMTQNLAWPMPRDEWFNASWSLTIEEWFYLLFSGALLGMMALTRRRGAAWIVILAFLIVPAVARMVQPEPSDFIDDMYHVALLRLDAIAYGVALAKLQHQQSRLFRSPLPAFIVGVALIAALWIQDVSGLWVTVSRMTFFLGHLLLTQIGLCLLLVGMAGLRIQARALS